MLKGRLFSWRKIQDSFFSSRGSVATWLIAAICFAIVFLGIITLLLWSRISDEKPPTVSPAINREVREPIKSFAVSSKGPEKSEKPVEKSIAPLENGLTETPDPSAREPLQPDPSPIQDVPPDDPPDKGVLSQDMEKQAPPVLSENLETPENPPPPPTVKPPLVAENSQFTDKALSSNVEKPSPAPPPQVSVPTEKAPAPVSEKTVAVKRESEGKTLKEKTVAVVLGNVRKGPSVKEKVLFTVAHGESLQVTDQKGNWYAVRLQNGRSGWVHRTLFHKPAASPLKTPSPSPKSGKKKSVINGIRTVVSDPNRAQIIFELSGYHPPEIMVIEGEVPRVVCDFFSAGLAPGVKKNLSVKTGFVKRIRVGVHKGSKPKVRVVLDLDSGRNYAVEQFFFEKENYYALMVNSGK